LKYNQINREVGGNEIEYDRRDVDAAFDCIDLK
jgi:hypothetical protein